MTATRKAKDYVFEELTVSKLFTILLNHQFTFESLRGMTMAQIKDAVHRINEGSIKSNAEVLQEKKEVEMERMRELKEKNRVR